MDILQLKKNVVQLYGEKYLGSGFLITPTLVVTARHVVQSIQELETVTLKSPCNPRLPEREVGYQQIKKHLDKDVALLEVESLEEYDLDFPKVYCSMPDYKTPYKSFGYPISRKDEGYPMEGWITNIHEHRYGLNNLELYCHGLKDDFRIDGASGSPLIIHEGIFGIMVTRDDGGALGALSFSECEDFLEEYGVQFEKLPPLPDYEQKLLQLMIESRKIGYDGEGKLPYVETLASWEPIASMETEYQISENHSPPQSLEAMIDEYFPNGQTYSHHQIFFAVADFGKGKSTFLKQLAANLAEKYLMTRNGEFPIYFNLRDYNEYVNQGYESNFGCIGNYLYLDYHIDFEQNQDFKGKKFIFLIDSLDENGSLADEAVRSVIHSVKQIRNLQPRSELTNKLIITSRPIPGVLKKIIENHEPHIIKDRKHFAALFGFTKEQFERYFNELEWQFRDVQAIGFNKEILDSIRNGKGLWDLMRTILHQDELRRPLLAYILYKLLLENYPIEKSNRLNIYLSFINLLTRDAKHIQEEQRNYKVSEQLGNRMLLYGISVMWMMNRMEGEGYLKTEQLEHVMGEGASLVHFLSHSYFEKKNDLFYFNHQSFAEMLLAEYYLRVFIYSAMHPNPDIEQIRARLSLGNATSQTMEFFYGLLDMLIVASSLKGEEEEAILKSRLALFPIVSSLGIEKFSYGIEKDNPSGINHFYLPSIKDFYSTVDMNDVSTISEEMVAEWPIKKKHLLNMADFAYKLMHSLDTVVYKKSRLIGTPYHKVEIVSEYERYFTLDMDRWIASAVWMKLFSNLGKESNFPTSNDFPISLLKRHNMLTDQNTPSWINYLTGNLRNQWEGGAGLIFQKPLVHMNLSGSYAGSHFYKLSIEDTGFIECQLPGADFSGSRLNNVNFSSCNMVGARFHEVILYQVSFNEVDLRGGELSATYLIGVKDMTNIRLQGTFVNIIMDRESFQKWKHKFKPQHKIRVIEMAEAEELVKQRIIDYQY